MVVSVPDGQQNDWLLTGYAETFDFRFELQRAIYQMKFFGMLLLFMEQEFLFWMNYVLEMNP